MCRQGRKYYYIRHSLAVKFSKSDFSGRDGNVFCSCPCVWADGLWVEQYGIFDVAGEIFVSVLRKRNQEISLRDVGVVYRFVRYYYLGAAEGASRLWAVCA